MTDMAAANSMVVLEQGDREQQTQRPTSAGRVSINKVPFKRSGSSLEIIPPEPEEDGDNKVSAVTVNNNERPLSRPSSSRVPLQRTSSPADQPSNKRPASRKSSSTSKDRPPSRRTSKDKPANHPSPKDRPPSRSGSKTSSLQRSSSNDNIRHSQSAGSCKKDSESSAVNSDVKKVLAESDGRSSSAEARIERCGTPKKQVYLPSVRRNYEQHGMPKDDALDVILRESLSSPIEQAANQSNPSNHSNGSQDSKASKENIDALLKKLSMRVDGSNVEGEKQERKGSGGKKRAKSKTSTAESENSGASKPSTSELSHTDAYYTSPGTDIADTDAYYTSPGTEIQNKEASEANPSTEETVSTKSISETPMPAATDPYYISHGADTTQDISNPPDDPKVVSQSQSDDESSSDEEESDEEDGPKAPIELLGEFVEAVMDEEWEDAEKLCKMVLMYEPDNAEAKQFQPMIEEMLRRERHEQLYGSDSDDESSDDEDSDDDDDEDDEDEDDSDEESSSSCSDSEEADEDENDDSSQKEAEKRAREAKMMEAIEKGATDEGR